MVTLGLAGLFLIAPYTQGYDLSLLLVPFAILGARVVLSPAGLRTAFPGMLLAAYLFPWLMVVFDWPQATLLIAALLCVSVWVACQEGRDEPDSAMRPGLDPSQ